MSFLSVTPNSDTVALLEKRGAVEIPPMAATNSAESERLRELDLDMLGAWGKGAAKGEVAGGGQVTFCERPAPVSGSGSVLIS